VRSWPATGKSWLSIGLERDVRLLALLVVPLVLIGCGGGQPRARNTPASALRGFYAALIGDRDPAAACRFAAPDFYLRPSGIVSVNVEAGVTVRPTVPSSVAPTDLRPVHGPCPVLLKRVLRQGRYDRYPLSSWDIQSIAVDRAAGSAASVTSDGSSAIRLVGDRWLMQWVFS